MTSGPTDGRVTPLLLVIVCLGLGAAVGWWVVKDDRPADSGTVDEKEFADVRSEVADLRREVGELKEQQQGLAVVPQRDAEVSDPDGPAARASRKLDPAKNDPARKDPGELMKLSLQLDPEERLAIARDLARTGNAWERSTAILTLLELDPAAGVAAVHGLLEVAAEDPKGAWSAARAVNALGALEGYPVAGDLYRIYESDLDGVRLAAARALERQGDDTLILRELAPLTTQLSSQEPRERLDAIWGMGQTRSPSAVPYLTPLLTSTDPETRIRALQSIGRTADPSSIALLEGMLNDPVAAVRDRAVEAIAAIRRGENRSFSK